jgi:hypothetical protein
LLNILDLLSSIKIVSFSAVRKLWLAIQSYKLASFNLLKRGVAEFWRRKEQGV